jgi:hypothetical protein
MHSTLLSVVALGLAASAVSAQARPPKPSTAAAITKADLEHRSYLYAADSMEGRAVATPGHVKATDYIAAELKRLGVEPAGENGTYFQTLPVSVRLLDTTTTLSVAGRTFSGAADYLARDQGPTVRSLDGVTVVYGGNAADTASFIPTAAATGRFVLLTVSAGAPPAPNRQMLTARFAGAAGIAVATLDRLPGAQVAALRAVGPQFERPLPPGMASRPVYAYVTPAMAEALMGVPLSGAVPGAAGQTVRGTIRFRAEPVNQPVRNVVGIVRGRDAARAGEFVVMGAHSDHVGMAQPVDHDSLLLANRRWRRGGADGPPAQLTPAQVAELAQARDSVKALRAPRADSVYNGADDDGSGSMGLLEVAEYFALTPKARPARSLLFVWHAAEEEGLWGSEWFTDHPTVPRDAMASAINIDMIGRGAKSDVENGGDRYLQLLGSRRLSSSYGDFVEVINRQKAHRFALDYTFDANGHPEQYYCRSDHWNYARYGIPVVFFSTGGHPDYHMVTDEAQYLDYPHFTRVVRFVADLAIASGNRPGRFALDKPVPGPNAQCVQ